MRTISVDDLVNGRVTTISQLVSARVEGLDLRGASIQSLRLIDCTFDRCVLDGGTFEDLRAWNTTFSECSFQKAKRGQFSFGGEHSGKFNIRIATSAVPTCGAPRPAPPAWFDVVSSTRS